MTSKRLIEIIEDAGYETREYSGRGMYGKQCVGFVVEPRLELGSVAEIVGGEDVNDEEREELIKLFKSCSCDNIGLDDVIVYFSRMKIE